MTRYPSMRKQYAVRGYEPVENTEPLRDSSDIPKWDLKSTGVPSSGRAKMMTTISPRHDPMGNGRKNAPKIEKPKDRKVTKSFGRSFYGTDMEGIYETPSFDMNGDPPNTRTLLRWLDEEEAHPGRIKRAKLADRKNNGGDTETLDDTLPSFIFLPIGYFRIFQEIRLKCKIEDKELGLSRSFDERVERVRSMVQAACPEYRWGGYNLEPIISVNPPSKPTGSPSTPIVSAKPPSQPATTQATPPSAASSSSLNMEQRQQPRANTIPRRSADPKAARRTEYFKAMAATKAPFIVPTLQFNFATKQESSTSTSAKPVSESSPTPTPVVDAEVSMDTSVETSTDSPSLLSRLSQAPVVNAQVDTSASIFKPATSFFATPASTPAVFEMPPARFTFNLEKQSEDISMEGEGLDSMQVDEIQIPQQFQSFASWFTSTAASNGDVDMDIPQPATRDVPVFATGDWKIPPPDPQQIAAAAPFLNFDDGASNKQDTHMSDVQPIWEPMQPQWTAWQAPQYLYQEPIPDPRVDTFPTAFGFWASAAANSPSVPASVSEPWASFTIPTAPAAKAEESTNVPLSCQSELWKMLSPTQQEDRELSRRPNAYAAASRRGSVPVGVKLNMKEDILAIPIRTILPLPTRSRERRSAPVGSEQNLYYRLETEREHALYASSSKASKRHREDGPSPKPAGKRSKHGSNVPNAPQTRKDQSPERERRKSIKAHKQRSAAVPQTRLFLLPIAPQTRKDLSPERESRKSIQAREQGLPAVPQTREGLLSPSQEEGRRKSNRAREASDLRFYSKKPTTKSARTCSLLSPFLELHFVRQFILGFEGAITHPKT
ncbi:hypothetical protein B0H34DRAFT_514467 [Crassisporium funariophilum]|nr:hypothetical protein B0H34DRAFT_514467 [Crassisporium funariophilum]